MSAPTGFSNPLLYHFNRGPYVPFPKLVPSHKVIKQKPRPVEIRGTIPADKSQTVRTYQVSGQVVEVRPKSFLPIELREKVTRFPDIRKKV